MALNSIRRIYGSATETDARALEQCKAILLSQFPYMDEAYADDLLSVAGDNEHRPFAYMLLVAESRHKRVLGLAVASHFFDKKFVFLDFIAVARQRASGGVGAALYERLREEARGFKAFGIAFDCLPDQREWCQDDAELRQNKARLKFYEKYGARPLLGTGYEAPRADKSIFHLVFDGLGVTMSLTAPRCKSLLRSVLEAKAAEKCSAEYIETVVSSIKGPVGLRPYRYLKAPSSENVSAQVPIEQRIALVVNEGHLIHHVRERGYLESPVRVTSILKELNRTDLFETTAARRFADSHLSGVHDPDYLKFLKAVCASIGPSASRYGDVFPIRNSARLPKDVKLQIGYYCIDASTPLNANAYIAARAAVDCALTAASLVAEGRQLAYALVRPPGHHAERRHFGGFCYLNSTATAAHHLSQRGRVAVLDIDYHHGNGQQNIFYERADVFTVSIHADPEYAYPNFTGFEDEQGDGDGVGHNLNITLPKGVTGEQYRIALRRALRAIAATDPAYVVVALGLDVAKGDPTGTWSLLPNDFYENGKTIGAIAPPVLVVQEGGYKNKVLATNARRFFEGLWDGRYASPRSGPKGAKA